MQLVLQQLPSTSGEGEEISTMEKIQWKVDGMTCANCALTIHKYLEKEGMKEVKVNAIGGDVSFEINGAHTKEELAIADMIIDDYTQLLP